MTNAARQIFISADIEGVGGVVNAEQGQPGNQEYERARRLMMGEVNAAVAGAFDGGATEVLVNDSHGPMRNLLIEDLDPRARLISGRPKPLFMMEGISENCAGVILLGYHACAGAERGVLAHTINGFAFARTMVHERMIGEAGLNGGIAGDFGVPVLMASGDDVFKDEMTTFFPHAAFAQVKRAIGTTCADSLTPKVARDLIRETVAAAVRHAEKAPPVSLGRDVPCAARMNSPTMADLVSLIPGTERLDGHTVGFIAPDALGAVRVFGTMSTMVQSLR
ncbi:M55 family metallopeptidase [Microvirga brassicacearum]|uniref:Aminopeptidase n=1 Tax=Microvirga brassicacearum TaxID=2580413 RepID=A0A5N3P6Z7_9HYPH|nr:M55 family metallopeptidase [Microvirga brassicacearum]KAB0265507.1 aminopeptidase [Microvirga brassicacearum]